MHSLTNFTVSSFGKIGGKEFSSLKPALTCIVNQDWNLYVKCDSRLAAHGGVVLQQFECIKDSKGKVVINVITEIVIFWQ